MSGVSDTEIRSELSERDRPGPSRLNRQADDRPIEDTVGQILIPIHELRAIQRQNEQMIKMMKQRNESSDSESDTDRESDKAPARKRARIERQNPNDNRNDMNENRDRVENQDDVERQMNMLLQNDNDIPANRPNDQNNDSDDDVIGNLQRDYDLNEDMGPEIDTKLASLVNTIVKGSMSEDKIEQKSNLHKKPRNVAYNVPKVNGEIWGIMDRNAKTKDLRSQRKQKLILTAMNCLAKVSQKCMESKDATLRSELLPTLTDAMGLVSRVNKELAMDRRASIVYAPGIDNKFRRLLSPDIPITDNLFGDDLKSAFSTIESSSKMGRALTASSKGGKRFPSKKYGNFNSGSKNGGRPRYIRYQGKNAMSYKEWQKFRENRPALKQRKDNQ